MIASLAMYDPPWLHAANDHLWSAIAGHLRARGIAHVPDALSRDRDLDAIWRAPDLLLAQSCGYPLMTRLGDAVQLVATPRYDAEGCTGAEHRAAILVRADDPATALPDLRGARAGINDWHSNTGMNLLRAAIAPLAGAAPFFDEVVVTGAHARSIAALAEGRIDIASVDAVTLAHIRRQSPDDVKAIRILAWTEPTPGLPLVTAAATPPETVAALRAALAAVAADPANRATLDALRITGFAPLTLQDYAPVLDRERQAASLHYPTLH